MSATSAKKSFELAFRLSRPSRGDEDESHDCSHTASITITTALADWKDEFDGDSRSKQLKRLQSKQLGLCRTFNSALHIRIFEND